MLRRKIKDCNQNIATVVQKPFETTSDNLCIENITTTPILTCLLDLENSLFGLEKAASQREKSISEYWFENQCWCLLNSWQGEPPLWFQETLLRKLWASFTWSLVEDRKCLASAQSEGGRRNLSMAFTFIRAGKFKTWNGLFPFKQLSRGLLKVTISPHMPYTTFIHK